MCNVCTRSSIHRKKARLLNPARAGGGGARAAAREGLLRWLRLGLFPRALNPFWLLRFNGAHLRSAGDVRERVSALTVPHITTCALDWKRTLTRYLEQHSPTPSDRSRSSIPYWLNLSSIAEPLYRARTPVHEDYRVLQGLIAFLSPFARIPTATHAFVAMHLSITPAC